ncbi:hypothetical protein HORIV_31090 [Vreelandella olivaria]|uniref:MarR family transcriptional regulator n=1 Tax=Vreelandella olivaria TaxID=390919 RepID=A0ABM7GJ65_9GAMM|nr:hypothetical protein HORIV_31090 [Halomonas olivaria]
MKSQDIGLLFKLVSLRHQEAALSGHQHIGKALLSLPDGWQDWELSVDDTQHDDEGLWRYEEERLKECYSVRALAAETGISKSQISLSLNRCIEVGLVRKDRKTGVPRANARALFDFIVHGLRYVFPARPGEITRGIASTFAAPVLKGQLYSAGELLLVWPDPRGNSKGQAVEPLFKTATYAVRRDKELYAMLALVDAIRLGHPRESKVAAEQLSQHLMTDERSQ